MAKNGYDQTYEDDRKENEETKDLVKKGLKTAGKALITPLAIPAGALVGGALGAAAPTESGSPGTIEGAKLGAKAAYNTLWGTDEDVKKNFDDARAANKKLRETKKEEPVKKRAGGTVRSSASKRADGCAVRGKTKGRIV